MSMLGCLECRERASALTRSDEPLRIESALSACEGDDKDLSISLRGMIGFPSEKPFILLRQCFIRQNRWLQ